MRRRQVQLPPLGHDFHHAMITAVTIGPRREATLSVMLRVCPVGHTNPTYEAVLVRFGGIENFVEVSDFFADGPHERSELANLRYAEEQRSKIGRLVFELVFERIDARLLLKCSSLQAAGCPDGSIPTV